MRDALHPIANVASLVWWAPSILPASCLRSPSRGGVDARLRRARRLLDVGRRDEALRVYAAVRAEVAADIRRARRGGVL